jgi:anti-sigma B factor antagonist
MTSHPRRGGRRSRRPIVPRHGTRPARRAGPDAPKPFRVSVEHHATVALVHISGEFDLSAVAPVERALERAVDNCTDDVVFDLRRVSFLDASGLKTIVRADERAHNEAFAVHVVRPLGHAARILALTAEGRALAVLDDLPGGA